MEKMINISKSLYIIFKIMFLVIILNFVFINVCYILKVICLGFVY